MLALSDSTPITVLAFGEARRRAFACNTGDELVKLSIENHSGPIWCTPSESRKENPPEPDASKTSMKWKISNRNIMALKH